MQIMYNKLKNLGHPMYLSTTEESVLQCKLKLDVADRKVCSVYFIF